jgi:hypothetical protein
MKVLMIYPYVPTLRFLKDFAEPANKKSIAN